VRTSKTLTAFRENGRERVGGGREGGREREREGRREGGREREPPNL
jgi:hypothetical protein